MSKKAIPFQVSQTNTEAAATIAAAKLHRTGADQWVHQAAAPDENPDSRAGAPSAPHAAASSLTVAISAEPDWFEAVKVGFLFPTLTIWWWTIAALHRNLRPFAD